MEGEVCFGEIAEPPDISGASAVNSDVRQQACVFPKSSFSDRRAGEGDYCPPLEINCFSRKSESLKIRAFREKFFNGVDDSLWNDWRWQLKNRFSDLSSLEKIIRLSACEKAALSHLEGKIPTAVTPYYAGLIDAENPMQAIRRCVVPVMDESVPCSGEKIDPLSEDDKSPIPGIVHRYPDRVLFLATSYCSVYCRYCTRSRLMGGSSAGCPQNQWEQALRYIEENSMIRDVLISGGDPLTLTDNQLEWILQRLRAIPHVEFIRIGTKVPVVLPQRITQKLVDMLRLYHPLWMSIHFTHPDELTPETSGACRMLADGGIPLGSQTVLLKGINDNPLIMRSLMHGLLKIRVKPYYLYQCDPVPGSSHFRTPVQAGLDIIRSLRGFTSGYAVPQYVIDAPGGGGKIPLLPDYTDGRDGDYIYLRNFENRTFRYPDPAESHSGQCS